MRISKLFQATLIGQIILFSLIAVTLSVFFSLTMQARLTEEAINRGIVISNSIADSNIELFLNRDASTIQSTIDQVLDVTGGVAYVFVVDDQEEFIAHTFVPGVPPEVLGIKEGAKDRPVIRDLSIANRGEFIDITSPILAGSVGYVHVGIDKGVIAAAIRSVVINQVGLIGLIFVVAIVMAYIQANRISRPLVQLAHYARQITSDSIVNWATLPSDPELLNLAKHKDEVGQLTSDFQHMVQEIHAREVNLKRRVTGLEMIANLSEHFSGILDLDQLMMELVNRSEKNFNFYQTHIYLIDEKREKLVIAAGTRPAEAEKKTKGDSILLNDPKSLAARAARTGEVVWVENVREAEGWLPDPPLPNTYSEMAVPIVSEGQVVGVLDVQQDKIAGLDEGDAYLLRSLANQVGVAIHNAHQFAEVKAALAEARALQQRYLEQSWEKTKTATWGGQYHYAQPDAPTLEESILAEAKQQALVQPRPAIVGGSSGSSNAKSIVAPVILGGKPIGALQLHQVGSKVADQAWTEQDLALVEAILDQIAQTAENLRLFDETRERAGRERTIREITDKLRAAPSLDTLLETAARELGQRLGVRHTVLELGLEAQVPSKDNGAVKEKIEK